MKISTRLILVFGIIILLFALCLGVAYHALIAAQKGMENVENVKMKKYGLILDMRNNLQSITTAVRNVALYNDAAFVTQEYNLIESYQNAYFQNKKELEEIMKSGSTQAEKHKFSQIVHLEKILFETVDYAAQLAIANRAQEAVNYLMTVNAPANRALMAALTDMTQQQMNFTKNSVGENREIISFAVRLLVYIAMISTLISVLTFFITIRTLMRELGGEPAQAKLIASLIAEGDLTSYVHLKKNDTTSLMASLYVMQVRLRSMVSKIKESSASVALSVDEISKGNEELSSRREQQSVALQEASTSVELLTSLLKNNTDAAQDTAMSARTVAERTKDGETDVKLMSETMNSIALNANKVRDITGVIESIAFQTTILALNAAVEAARAGEDGRGFAVVAGEVRMLAQRSADAARDIKMLIEQAVSKVESGVIAAGETGGNILSVVGEVGELAEAMDHIALSSSEQIQGISRIEIAINQVDSLTRANASLVEDSTSALSSLSGQAHSLKEMTSVFRV